MAGSRAGPVGRRGTGGARGENGRVPDLLRDLFLRWRGSRIKSGTARHEAFPLSSSTAVSKSPGHSTAMRGGAGGTVARGPDFRADNPCPIPYSESPLSAEMGAYCHA